MHADRINILHAADRNRMIIGIPHDLKLDFLVALYGFFNQNLMNRRQLEGIDADLNQFFFVVGKSASGTAKRECRS